MRRLAISTALMLAVAACGGTTAETTSPGAPTATTTPAATTATSAPAVETTSTTLAATTTAPAPASGPRFALARIGLGVLGQVVVINLGTGPGSLAGYFLCHNGAYYEFPDVVVPLHEMAAVSVTGRDEIFDPPSDAINIEGIADIGPFDPVSGEVGLYSSNAFADPNAIVSYVEWGNSGHPRSATAVAAGVWTEGGFLETSDQTGAIFASLMPSTGPQDWVSGG